jgi:hypothetical protein
MNHSAHSVPSTALKALSLAVATLLMQSHALATPSPEELNSVKLYGDVTIAQDSVNNWGPWEQFEAPAAAPGALSLPRTTVDFFRTLPKATENLIGFGAFTTLTFSAAEGGEGGGQQQNTDGPHPLSLTGTALASSTSGSIFPDSVQVKTSPLSTGSYAMPDSGKLTLQDGAYSRANDHEQVSLALFPADFNDSEKTKVSFYVKTINEYINSPENRTQRVTWETGVIGYRTSITDIAALHIQGAKADYVGNSLTNNGFAPMVMHVDFGGAGSWNGTWNNGVDSNGAVGFSASGSMNGAQFSSTSITTRDEASISGSVKGAFFGPNAAAVGGVADITKNETRYVNPFLAVKQAPLVQQVPQVQPDAIRRP